MDVHRLEKNISSKVPIEVDCVMTTVESRVQDAMLTTIQNLAIPRVELAVKPVNALAGNGDGSVVLDPDERECWGKVEGLQMTASSRINSRTDLNRID